MTKYTFAEIPQWVAKVRKVQEAVVKQATGDLIADIEVVPGINRGGARVAGTIPRDLGALARSLRSSLYGSTSMQQQGEDSHVLVVGAMRVGDVARFSWGGDIAPYARHVHDGANGVQGTHWIDHAAARWDEYVTSAVRRAKRELGVD